jgi:hypothetical protein
VGFEECRFDRGVFLLARKIPQATFISASWPLGAPNARVRAQYVEIGTLFVESAAVEKDYETVRSAAWTDAKPGKPSAELPFR